MSNDEQAIRELMAEWMRASASGDSQKILSLMSEDVVFLTPGNPPMRGRDAFERASGQMAARQFKLDGKSDIEEIQVAGDWAFAWTRLSVTITPPGPASPMRRSGHTLTIFRKQPDGKWVLARDANVLTPEPSGAG